ncbi:MAG: NADH-quinone oxidoreductase subunit NuoE [Nitrospira sp.]|nr:NADH-quinone oxidoreductase subunit NuoE [Nitrospira sp.]MDE0486974.1 NADH-quinone oxidoreductase subunit NuoE [Nitrospira sp.]
MIFDKHQDTVNDILGRYPVKRSAMLPLLNLAQKEEGYVSQAAIREIAGILDLTPPQVFETATFYTMLNLKPIGKFHVQVCRSLMCALVGADPLIEWLRKHLGIGLGQTTGDKLFTLSTVECLGSCGTGPMMQINDDYYERLTEEKVGQILKDLRGTGDCSLKSGPFLVPERGEKVVSP